MFARPRAAAAKRPAQPSRGKAPPAASSNAASSSNDMGESAPKGSPHAPVKVVLRVRPPLEQEIEHRQVISVLDTKNVIFNPKEEIVFKEIHHQLAENGHRRSPRNVNFTFDQVFGPEVSNDSLYTASVSRMVDTLMGGFNCTVFAYGSTGSGKTFTMLGSPGNPGLTPLLMDDLYERLANEPGLQFDLVMSYLEIYNEIVRDLLVPKVEKLDLLESGKEVLVTNLSWCKPLNMKELMERLEMGNARRTQHPTDANAESSRSHAIFQLKIKMTRQGATEKEYSMAQLSMVDLAGSERAASSKNDAARFLEGANINRSLLALGNCINALAEGQNHIPYRNSKLTRLLKGSLGGNCCTVMIANISPCGLALEETSNTLKYACRAMKIINNVRGNTVSSADRVKSIIELEEARWTNMSLEAENRRLKQRVATLEMRERIDAESLEFVIRKIRNLLEAKIDEEQAAEAEILLRCQRENLLERYNEKKAKLERLKSLSIGEHLTVMRQKLEERLEAKLKAMDDEKEIKQAEWELSANYISSVWIDFHHFRSQCKNNKHSELLDLFKSYLHNYLPVKQANSDTREIHLMEALDRKRALVDQLHHDFCAVTEEYCDQIKVAKKKNFITPEMLTNMEKIKALVRGDVSPEREQRSAPSTPTTGSCDAQEQQNVEIGVSGKIPQAFMFKNTPGAPRVHRPTAGHGEHNTVTPSAFMFKNSPTHAAASHTPPACSE